MYSSDLLSIDPGPFALIAGLLFLFFTGLALPGRGQTIIAQQQNYISNAYVSFHNYTDPTYGPQYDGLGQSFKSLITGTIGTIQFYINAVYTAGTTDVEIYNCTSATAWGSLIATATGIAVNSSGWVTADLSALNIPVTAGNFYGFRLRPHDPLNAGGGLSTQSYPDGQATFVGSDGAQGALSGYQLALIVLRSNHTLQAGTSRGSNPTRSSRPISLSMDTSMM